MSKWNKFMIRPAVPVDGKIYLCKQDPKKVASDFVYIVLWYDAFHGVFRGWDDTFDQKRHKTDFFPNVIAWKELPKIKSKKRKGGKLEKED